MIIIDKQVERTLEESLSKEICDNFKDILSQDKIENKELDKIADFIKVYFLKNKCTFLSEAKRKEFIESFVSDKFGFAIIENYLQDKTISKITISEIGLHIVGEEREELIQIKFTKQNLLNLINKILINYQQMTINKVGKPTISAFVYDNENGLNIVLSKIF